MPHALTARHPDNAIGHNPLVATLRYRCSCANNEVVTIHAVIDANATEDMFLETMKRLLRDVKFEVEQHLRPTGEIPP